MKYDVGSVVGDYTIRARLPDYVSPKGSRTIRLEVECNNCGSIKDVYSSNFKRSSKTCNCSKWLTAGQKVGKWTLLGEDTYKVPSSGELKRAWNCKCECGTERLIAEGPLKFGSTKSCGCEPNKTHGLSKTRAYSAYNWMMKRTDPDSKDAEYYFNKGIFVCDEWKDSENGLLNFYRDMGECPDGFELERIDYNKGYSPENCTWVDEQRQAENRGRFSNNTSGKTGVTWDDSSGKWRVTLMKSGVQYEGGRFISFEDAVKAREDLELNIIGYIKGH